MTYFFLCKKVSLSNAQLSARLSAIASTHLLESGTHLGLVQVLRAPSGPFIRTAKKTWKWWLEEENTLRFEAIEILRLQMVSLCDDFMYSLLKNNKFRLKIAGTGRWFIFPALNCSRISGDSSGTFSAKEISYHFSLFQTNFTKNSGESRKPDSDGPVSHAVLRGHVQTCRMNLWSNSLVPQILETSGGWASPFPPLGKTWPPTLFREEITTKKAPKNGISVYKKNNWKIHMEHHRTLKWMGFWSSTVTTVPCGRFSA